MTADDVTERAAKWIVARAIHEHDANASMSGEPWPTWNELYVEGREAYAYVGEAVAQALDAAGWLATPERDAAVAAEWADYFEVRQGTVGPEPLTVESMIAALRAPRPFGCEAGESDER